VIKPLACTAIEIGPVTIFRQKKIVTINLTIEMIMFHTENGHLKGVQKMKCPSDVRYVTKNFISI